MDCHGTLALKISCRELDGTVWKKCIVGLTECIVGLILKKVIPFKEFEDLFFLYLGHHATLAPLSDYFKLTPVFSSVGLPNVRKHLKPRGYRWVSGSHVVVRLEIL